MAYPIHASSKPGFKRSDSLKYKSSLLRKAFFEGGHYLEKLEFALAIAETQGDKTRCELLRSQISELGGNVEEPGT